MTPWPWGVKRTLRCHQFCEQQGRFIIYIDLYKFADGAFSSRIWQARTTKSTREVSERVAK